MKKSLLLFSTCLSINVQAQTVILEESLNSVIPSNGDITESPDGYEYWSFINCYSYNSHVQVGKTGLRGSVTTSPLTGLNGNAQVFFTVYPVDTLTIKAEALNAGNVINPFIRFNKKDIQKKNTLLLRSGSNESRLKFTSLLSGTKRFELSNIIVKDIDDAVFYESFNECDGQGGRNNYSNLYHDDEYVANKNTDKFDYTSSSSNETAFVADKCLFCYNGGRYTTPALNIETNNCAVFFKAAGRTINSSSALRIIYNSYEIIDRNINKGEWRDYVVLLPNVTNDTHIDFYGTEIYLDEIKVVEIKELGIDEAATDVSAITEKMGKYVDAQLTRTFKKNIWNTCCLPFTVKASYFKEVAGDDLEISILKLHDITADGVFNFEDADEVAAGEPFLLQVNKDITNPLFTRVKITADAGATKTDANATGYAFKGILCKTALNTDHTDVFLGTDEELHYPTTSGNLMRGMRAYFTIPEGANINAKRIAIIDSTEGISEQPAVQPNSPIYYYNMKGQQVQHPTKGFYIVRSADGRQQSKKVLVK